MKRFAFPIAASIAAVTLMASAASAATYVNYGPTGPDGGFSITFGNTGITGSNFTDTFDFTMPTGRGDFVITSTMSGTSQNITWSSIAFNGEAFDSGSAGWNEFNFLNGVKITKDAQQQLVLTGVSGGNASYSGVITFMPTATGPVPEPASWALMITGFGAAGALVRRRKAALLA